MKNTIYFLLMLLPAVLASPASGQGQTPATVAVMTLSCTGLSDADAEFLSERLMIELTRTGRFEVLERTKRDEVLKERDFQVSGACAAAACLAEAGRLLAVNKAVGGSVGQLGQVISVQVRLVDIATGGVEATAVRDYRGGLELLLTSGMREVARELAGMARPQPADSVKVPARLTPAVIKQYPRSHPTSSFRLPGATYGSWALAAGLGMLAYIYHHQADGYGEVASRQADPAETDRLRSESDAYASKSKTASIASFGFAGLGAATALFRYSPKTEQAESGDERQPPRVEFQAGPDGIRVSLAGRL